MPKRGELLAVLVGLLVLTAGCSGSTNTGTTSSLTETPTEPTTTVSNKSPSEADTKTTPSGKSSTDPNTATPTDGSSTGTATDGSTTGTDTTKTRSPIETTAITTQTDKENLPPLASQDWMDNGRLNLSALFLRHVEALRAASGYQVQSNYTYTLQNGSKSTDKINIYVDADQAVLRVRRSDRWDFSEAFINRRYVNESAVSTIQEFGNGTVIRRSAYPSPNALSRAVRDVPVTDTGFAFGGEVNWTADGRTVFNGQPVYRYRGVKLSNRSELVNKATLSSASMLVDRDGRIRHITIKAQGEFSFVRIKQSLPATLSFEVTLSGLNATTVEPPSWVSSGE